MRAASWLGRLARAALLGGGLLVQSQAFPAPAEEPAKTHSAPLAEGQGLSSSALPRGVEGRSPLTLEELLQSVDSSFPLLKAAELERELASADLLTAEGGFDLTWKSKGTLTPLAYYESLKAETLLEKPTELWGASAFAGWRYGRGEFPIYEGKSQTLEGGELRAGVNLPLWKNGPIDRRRATLRRAELGPRLAELTVAQQRLEIRRAATHRYWGWVVAGRRLAIAEDLLRIALTRDAGLRFRVEKGDLPPYERTDNARAIEQRKAQVAQAARGLEQASLELSLYLRDASGSAQLPSPSRLPAALEPPALELSPVDADLDAARSRRPEVERLQLQRKQNELERRYAENQQALGVDLQVAASRDLGPSMESRPDLSKPVLEASALIDVPLQTRAMEGRADSARVAAARLARQEAFARDRIETDVRDARSALTRASERIGATRREVALAEELEHAERTRFEQGDSHLLFVNMREQHTAEARLREAESILELLRARADLDAARGSN